MNIYENLRRSKHKNNNEMEKEMSIAELVAKMNEVIDGKKLDRNVINRIENGSQQPTPQQLVAYSKVFNVSVDFILDNVKTKSSTENMKSISKYLGLSDITIKEIKKLKADDKLILDTMIKRYNLLTVLSDIRRLIAFRSLLPNVKVVFEEETFWENGNPIDKELVDTINNQSTTHYFNESVNSTINNVIENIVNDAELEKYFCDIYKSSKIKGRPLTVAELPRLNPDTKKIEPQNKGSDD